MAKKTKKWTKPRHTFITKVAGAIYKPVVKSKYHVNVTPYKDRKEQCLILFNHQTAYDQFFVSLCFKKPIYFVASEDLFSMGFVSKLLNYLVAPIPIKKQTTDPRAVMNCIKVAKEGGSIALAPEGNRTYSGKTEYINPAIVSLIKHLKLPVCFFRIEGGYGVHPRWSDKTRKGQMNSYVSKTLRYDDYKDLSNQEFYEIIKKELYVDETEILGEYHSKNLAEGLERAVYVCPYCGFSHFITLKDVICCEKCKKTVRYMPNKTLKPIQGEFPFKYFKDWYEYQSAFVRKFRPDQYGDNAIFSDTANFYRVIPYKRKKLISSNAKVSLFKDKIIVNEHVFSFDELSAVTVLGKNKLNLYYKDEIYQLKPGAEFCALKYVNLFYRYKNFIKGDQDGNVEFLGL